MRRSEAGSAFLVVLMALIVLLPLALLLGKMVTAWQRQSVELRRFVGLEYAARAGLAEAALRIGTGAVDVPPGSSRSFALSDPETPGVAVRVRREPDVVLTLEGVVLEGTVAARADLDAMVVDPDFRRVHRFRRVQIFLVEVRAAPEPSRPGVRLWGILIRTPGGPLQQAGARVERGFFEADERR